LPLFALLNSGRERGFLNLKEVKMKINRKVTFIYPGLIIMALLALSFSAYANAGLAALYVYSFDTFSIGTICILIIEYVYCIFMFKKSGYLINFLFVITANMFTAIIGVLALNIYSRISMVNDPLRIFLLCYAVTVPIEALLLKEILKSTEELTFLKAFLNSVLFNLLSYIGIVAIFYKMPVIYRG